MSEPQRIQRQRAKGWKMPENTVYVGRGSIWGNPFKPGEPCGVFPVGMGLRGNAETLIQSLSLDQAIRFYRDVVRGFVSPEMYPYGHALRKRLDERHSSVHELRGRNLACWCPLDAPCHADVLLELANKASPHD
jgi:hypothetical protein